jgi:serine/threonine kinase 16
MSYGPLAMLVDVVRGVFAWLFSLCSFSCTSAVLEVNHRKLKVSRLLAEGGFSFVYLVVDTKREDERFALKKILSQLPEQSELARWEISVHNAFDHPNLMPLVDHATVALPSGAEEHRLLMPVFPHGTLLDRALKSMGAGTRMAEKDALAIFAQLLDGVSQFHQHTPAWAHRIA